jgi:hypothetical protein
MADAKLDEIFNAALEELSAARVAYEDDPRNPDHIARLGRARVVLEAARADMRAERIRLGLEPDPELDKLIAKADAEPRPLWQGLPSD